MIKFINPKTKVELIQQDDRLVDPENKTTVAKIVNDIPRFVEMDNYADSFGWQWNKWEHNLSESRSNVKKRDLIIKRTHFDKFDFADKNILECGMGGGDDTEVLLTFPFKSVHSFDLSNAVERANKYLRDERLVITQASIYEIPYPDFSFDVVYCHRVLQHTPDPEKSLRCICKKVKKDGILFIHSYKKTKRYLQEWKYKYRWFTKGLPKVIVYYWLEIFGPSLHRVVHSFYARGGNLREFAYRYIPFYRIEPKAYPMFGRKEIIELEKLVTFDALTPTYDFPISTEKLLSILKDEDFEILFLEDSLISPVYATAKRQ